MALPSFCVVSHNRYVRYTPTQSLMRVRSIIIAVHRIVQQRAHS